VTAQVRAWSVVHALVMLLAAPLALTLHDARPAAALGGTSLLALLALYRGRYTPAGGFGAANTVTLLRMLLIVGLSGYSASPPGPPAALLVLLILVLDGIDGRLARRFSLASEFGARFDMECDALLVFVSALVLYLPGRLGAFILVAGLLRYAYVVGLLVWPEPTREAPRSSFGRTAFTVMVLSIAASMWPIAALHVQFAIAATSLLVYSFARSIYASRAPVA